MSYTVPTSTATHRAAVVALGPNTPLPGRTVLQKYEVERVLGQGSMGVVIGARHRHLDQRVAIKVLSTHLREDEMAMRRALGEARTATRIANDHVVRVFDFLVDEESCPCIVMEYLDGRDLSALVGKSPIPVEDVAGYMLHACDALATAHEAGVIHRDLKPANLFLTHRPDGAPFVKVLDFGVSRMVGPGALGKSSGNLVVGSVAYMSPEQIATPKDVDARADIWGLGVVLYELLTGKLPFDGETVGTMVNQIMTAVPAPASSHRPDVPPGLEMVIRRCLMKSAHDRFASFRELAVALAPWAPPWAFDEVARLTNRAETTQVGRLAAATNETPRRGKFGPVRLALAAALVIAAGVGTAAALWTRPSSPVVGTAASVENGAPEGGVHRPQVVITRVEPAPPASEHAGPRPTQGDPPQRTSTVTKPTIKGSRVRANSRATSAPAPPPRQSAPVNLLDERL